MRSVMTILCAVSGLATTDPGGWNKVKWGMTEAQVRAAVPAAEHFSPDADQITEPFSNAALWISRFQMDGSPYRVFFCFDRAGKLVEVGLRPPIEPVLIRGKMTWQDTDAFADLRARLVDKYGTPWRSGDHDSVWKLEVTEIRLSEIVDRGAPRVVTLSYRRALKNSSEL